MCPVPDSHGSQKDRLANSNFFAVSFSLDSSYSLCSYLRIATGVCELLRWMKPLGKGFLSEARAPIGHPRPLLGTSIFKINTAVSRISSADIEPLFEVREALEVQSARLAARRCSPVDFACLADDLQRISLQLDEDPAPEEYYELVSRMDRMIDQAADNSWLVTALETVRTQLIRVRRLSAHDPTRLVRAAQEHAAIARAISSGSEQLAEAAVRLHLHEALNAAREKTETTTLERTS